MCGSFWKQAEKHSTLKWSMTTNIALLLSVKLNISLLNQTFWTHICAIFKRAAIKLKPDVNAEVGHPGQICCVSRELITCQHPVLRISRVEITW